MVLCLAGQKLSAEDCEDSIEVLIAKEAIRQHVSVDLALAIAKIESNFNPTAVGGKGEIGLFQIMPYNAPKAALFNPKVNITIGIGLLKKMSIKCADMGDYWVVCYNNGSNRRPRFPYLHPYWKKLVVALR